MKHRISVIWPAVLMMLFFISSLQAQDKKTLTLKEAVDLAIKNSKQLKGSQAKIQEAIAAVKEAKGRALPEVKTSASYLRLNNPNFNLKTKKDDNGASSDGAPPKISQAAYAMANLSLPVYSGLRIKYGIQSAKYLEQATRLDADNDREEIVINAIDAYNNLYKSKAAVDLVKESLEQAKQRVKEFSNLEKNGLLARNDYLKAELQASNTELSLLDAENNFKLATITLDLLLGLPENTSLVTDSADLALDASVQPVEEYVALALKSRKDLEAISFRKKAAETGVKSARSEKYPSIALTGGYLAVDVPHTLVVTNAINIGVGIQYSLSSLWNTKSKVNSAKARETEIEANQEMLEDAIRLQVNRAYQNYLISRKKIDVFSAAVRQAMENYTIVKNKYNNGLATVTDLLDADVAQLQSKLNYAFAQSDATVAYKKLLQSAGILNNQ